jgi:hypothetical protein
MFWEDKREMSEQTKREYQEYLDYMYEYEEENGSYPMHLSNGQWTPYSTSEYLDKTENGTKRLNFNVALHTTLCVFARL